MPSKPIRIVCDHPDPLVRHAAEELRRYIHLLFGFRPAAAVRAEGAHISVGTADELDPEEFILRRQGDSFLCAGGTPRAALWAAYALVEEWGVQFLIQGDVLPDEPGPFRLPKAGARQRPVFRRRGFRVINEMANSGVFWSLADHRRLFDQLAKNRFNGILISAGYPFHPWIHWEFRGVPRANVALCYGFRHPIHERTIGRELFGGVAEFTNPDFQGAHTYEEMIAAGRRFMTGLIDAAHERGLDTCLTMGLSDLPIEVLRHLPAWTEAEGIHLPAETVGQTHCSRLGLQIMSPPEISACCTPLNPVYVDMVESWLRAHIEAYPKADYYFFGQAEFPPAGAGLQECWDALNTRHGVESAFPLAMLEEKARGTPVTSLMPPERMLTELHGAIQTLRMWDIMVNERQIAPGKRCAGSFMSEYLQPVVPLVMPPETFEFLAIVDYLPAHVAQRMHTLAYVKDSKMAVSMITTIEDDNVGFFPQLTTQSLHRIVQAMRECDLEGFWFRQFDISEHEASMHYMIRAAWDADATPDSTYRQFARQTCGEEAEEAALALFRGVEELGDASNGLVGAGFLMPNLYAKYWNANDPPEELRAQADRMRGYVERVATLLPLADILVEYAAPRGKPWSEHYRLYLRFAIEYPRTLACILDSRRAYLAARQSLADKQFLRCCSQMDESVSLLEDAFRLSETALRTWAALTVDPTDLGTLAALNAYGHDYLRGLAWQIFLESQVCGFSV